jgi:hypothetical protein
MLRVTTPPRELQLDGDERAALVDMASACCHNVYNNSNSIFCSAM